MKHGTKQPTPVDIVWSVHSKGLDGSVQIAANDVIVAVVRHDEFGLYGYVLSNLGLKMRWQEDPRGPNDPPQKKEWWGGLDDGAL